MKSYGNWNVVIAGECMVTRPFSMHNDARFMGVVELLRNSDVTCAHLEMNIAEFDEVEWPSKAEWLGSFMLADPVIAGDLRWAGIDIMSLAHNHSFDFGASGLMATIRHCRRAGLAVAGTGRDLEEAREPTYVEKPQGRVAMVSVSSGNKPFEWAGLPKATMRGRPGVNPQRLSMKYMIDQEAADQLKAIAEKLDVLRTKRSGVAGVGFQEDEFGIIMPGEQSMSGSNAFIAGDRFEILSHCHQRDLEGNMRSIDEARTMADLVIVAHHFNVSEGKRGDHPPKFVRDFAHAAIEAGADIYVGHFFNDTATTEIYKGKPIIYGIGNFFAQSEFIRRVPYDSYEAWGHDVDRLPTLTPAAHPLHPGFDTPSDTWWTSAILGLDIQDQKLVQIELHPVDMGREATKEAELLRTTGRGPHPLTEGRPMLAEADNSARVLERYQRLSAEYGTDVRIEKGVGIVKL
jgi:poly-gamma-glutamate synthesis protein (capsule biosynthesis protein)